MPQARDEVRLRTAGVAELADETLVRFGTTEPHAVVRAALAAADLYGPVLHALGLPPQAVLAVSCFAVTDEWSASRLAQATNFVHYHTVSAGELRELEMELWATATCHRGVADRRNPAHFRRGGRPRLGLGRAAGENRDTSATPGAAGALPASVRAAAGCPGRPAHPPWPRLNATLRARRPR